MYSLTVKPSLVPKLSASSSSSSYPWPRLCFLTGLSIKTKSSGRRFGLKLHAYDSSKSETPNANGDSKPPNGTLVVGLLIFFFFNLYDFLLFWVEVC